MSNSMWAWHCYICNPPKFFQALSKAKVRHKCTVGVSISHSFLENIIPFPLFLLFSPLNNLMSLCHTMLGVKKQTKRKYYIWSLKKTVLCELNQHCINMRHKRWTCDVVHIQKVLQSLWCSGPPNPKLSFSTAPDNLLSNLKWPLHTPSSHVMSEATLSTRGWLTYAWQKCSMPQRRRYRLHLLHRRHAS